MTLQIQLSGGNGNTDINSSLGGVISGTALVDATVENLFDDVRRKEILVGKTEFRGFYIKNTHASLQVHGGVVYVDADPSQTTIQMGLDPAGAGDGATTGVMQTISSEDTVPSGVTFEDAGEFRLKIPIPKLEPLESIGIWIQRVAVGSGAAELITVGVTMTGNEEALIPANKTISGNTLANPTVVTTTVAHGLVNNNVITITGSNSTPSIDGVHTITYISTTTFSVPVNVTVAGTAGTVAVGGDIYDDGQDGLSIGERTEVLELPSQFKIGEAQVGFSLIS
jgi:hypothetical protein